MRNLIQWGEERPLELVMITQQIAYKFRNDFNKFKTTKRAA
jgi:hypothetical protein